MEYAFFITPDFCRGKKGRVSFGEWRGHLDSLHALHAVSARPLAAVWRALRMASVEGPGATMAVAGGSRSTVPAIPETARLRPRLRRRETSSSAPEVLECGMWFAGQPEVVFFLRLVLFVLQDGAEIICM